MRAQSTRVLVLLCPGEGAKSEQRGKEQVSSWLPHKLSRKDRSVNKKDMHHFRGLHKARYLIILHPKALRNAPIDSKFKTKVELMRHTFFTTPDISFVPWSPKRSATMLDLFAQLFQHCWIHASSLCMVYKDLWVVSFPRCPAGPNIVGSCCIRLHTTANTHATTPNIVGATMLGVVASVCTQPYPAAYTFLSFEIAEVCLPLANWRLYKRHYLIVNDWVAKTFQQRPGSSKFACIKFIIQFTHKLKPSFYGVSKFLFTDHFKTTHSRRQHTKST